MEFHAGAGADQSRLISVFGSVAAAGMLPPANQPPWNVCSAGDALVGQPWYPRVCQLLPDYLPIL